MSPRTPTRPTVFERHARLALAVLIVLFALVTDVAFTHAYRLIHPVPSARSRGGTRTRRSARPVAAESFPVRSRVYHHGHQAFEDRARFWGPRRYYTFTNSLGFVDRAPRLVELRPAGRRLVFIGDSFTEGLGVLYSDTFSGLVETALAPEGISVLNASSVSYSPIIYYRKMKYYLEHGLIFDQLAVFLDISDAQDEVYYQFDDRGYVVSDEARERQEKRANHRYGGVPQPDPLESTALGRFLAEHTTAVSRAYSFGMSLIFGGTKGSQVDLRRGLWTVEPPLFEAYAREGLRRATDHMDMLHELLAARGIRLTVAVYPWPDQIVRGDLDSLQVRAWRTWARARNVAFVDYFPRFIDGTPPADVLRRYFIPGDVHWNEAGHRLVSDVFLEYFRAHQR